MTRPFVSLAALLVGLSILALGCAQAAPTPTPTSAPAAPKAAEPTKAAAPAAPTKAPAAAAPTSAPAAKTVAWPEKGRSVNYIVPFAPGGSTDITARLMTPYMEQDLGVPFNIMNKPGGDTQVGMTELVKAKPDGYTLGTLDFYATILTYLQPDRQTIYTRKDFTPIAMFYKIPAVWMVKADSPYKSVKDLVDAAKARPETIKVGDTGAMGPYHLANVLFDKLAGTRMNHVHFEGAGPAATAALGGHVDVSMISITGASSPVKSGQARLLAVMDSKRSPFIPDAPTMEEQGYKHYMTTHYAVVGPAGVPKEVVEILRQSILKAQANPDFQKKAFDASLVPLAADFTAAQVEEYFAQAEKEMKEMLELAKAEIK